MKKLLCIVSILVICSFSACKKAEEKDQAEGKQLTRQGQIKKKQKKGKGGARTLQIYQEGKLIVAIPREEYSKMTTTTVKVDGKDIKAILLSDLLKAHNVTGKNIVLKGRNQTATITWEQATTNPIYIYPVKNRLQIYHDSTVLEDAKLPLILVRIDASDNPVAAGGTKRTKK